ncbi:MAG: sulfur carrier protein ThiS [bacterium]
MEIKVNGEEKKLAGPITISGLLKELEIDPETVVVERNLEILNREDHEGQTLTAGDNVEIIQLVDGG